MPKQPNFSCSQSSTLLKEALAKSYLSTTFGLSSVARATRSSTCYSYLITKIGNRSLKRPIFWKLPGLGIFNMNFLITDVILFASGTMIIFKQGDTTKIKSKQFSEFRFWTSFQSLNSCEFISGRLC